VCVCVCVCVSVCACVCARAFSVFIIGLTFFLLNGRESQLCWEYTRVVEVLGRGREDLQGKRGGGGEAFRAH
jgi:hypothetical protein